jgi:flagellin-like protein
MTKGVSPLVATVLLVAATMSIAGILAYWTSGFVKSTLPEINTTQEQCKYSGFKIYQCSYSNTTSQLLITLNNYKTIEVKNLVLYSFFSNGTTSSGINLNQSLIPGEFKTYTINNFDQNFTKIIISSLLCPSLLPEEATCTRS